MFVFWYCHKRGKQVRLDREKASEAEAKEGEEEGEYVGSDFEATDSDEGDSSYAAEQIANAVRNDRADTADSKDDILNQPEPSQVPLPDTDKGEKGAALEAEKSVGV